MRDLSAIIKAYDIRGLVPEQLDEDTARDAGAAFVRVVGADRIVTAYDMRPSSPSLAQAFAAGATAQGADVLEAGLGSTDMLYYASGSLDVPGAMFTASHNPAQYNGIKMCRAGASPIGERTGLSEIRGLMESGPLQASGRTGTVQRQDILGGYVDKLLSLVEVSAGRRLKVVVDAGNGMAGYTVPPVFARLPVDLVPMYFELDGTFPNHEANPIDPVNLRDLQRQVLESAADIGLAFDGDADRCFVVDERGRSVSPSTLTALIAVRELAKDPGSPVIHNLITSRAVPEIVLEHGGVPIRTRVGHSFIKQVMAETGAVFGGEHSGHFYFRDFWRADSGMLAALHVLAALSESPLPLSELLGDYERYEFSGEINSEVPDPRERTRVVRESFAARPGAEVDTLDGLTVSLPGHRWFNLRPSNTEPLLRLNAEAPDRESMELLRDEVLELVREGSDGSDS